MVGVREQNLDIEVLSQVALRQALDGGLGAHRHEHRRFYGSMRGVLQSRSRVRDGTLGHDFKLRHIYKVGRPASPLQTSGGCRHNPIMLRLLFTICAWLLVAQVIPAQTAWRLVWSDEFDGPANSAPDQTKWAYDTGATGWGNQELENYTKSPDNASLDGKGDLVIRAVRTASGYTSARLKTQGKFTTTYGKIEARMRIPYGQGLWPAFWMLGSDIDPVGWPGCGEIDIMENIGREP